MAHDGSAVTFAELVERSARAANLLRRLGLRPGDGIAVLMENNPRYFDVVLGGTAIRAVLHDDQLPPRSRRGHATSSNDSASTALVTSPRLAGTAEEIARGMPLIARYVAGDMAELPDGFESLDAAAAGLPATRPPDETEGAAMIYSSGTTRPAEGGASPAQPRGIRPRYGRGHVVGERYPFGPDTVYLSPAPLYHAAPLGWSMAVQALGGTV